MTLNKQKIVDLFKWRKTLVQSYEIIKNAVKSSEKADLSDQGQLDLFSAGLEVEKTLPKLIEYEGGVDLMEMVDLETEYMGLPITYEPLNGLDMYVDIYCTHSVYEVLELTDKTENIIILDRVVIIEYKISQKGNKYCKLFLSQMGETYIYLWGQQFRDLISRIFTNEIYLLSITFNIPTKDFDRYSYVCNYIQNIKDVEIEEEYNRIYNNCKVEELDKHWMIKNRKL